MSILGKLVENKESTNLELKDFSGSSFIGESGLYNMKVAKAFVMESNGGAIGIYVQYEGDAQFDETLWITNKEKKTYFSRNGKDTPMPSYVISKKMNYIFSGDMVSSLSDLKTENRLVKHFKYVEDPENEGKKKKVDDNIEAEVLVDWIGKELKLLIQMVQKEGYDKVAKKPNGKGALTKDGEPVTDPIVIDVFNTYGLTATELFKGEESKALQSGLDRISKSPIRMFKARPNASTSSSTQASQPARKPSVF